MSLIRNKRIGKENDVNGMTYQIYVAKHLEKRLGKDVIVSKKHGIDIICEKLQIEVKGMKKLYYQRKVEGNIKRGWKTKIFQERCWKVNQMACPETITHFAYVLAEKYLCNIPLIYMVGIDEVRKRFAEYPDSQWVVFWLKWVWDHYIPELSLIPEIGLERKRINELATEIYEELMSPGANYEDLRNWADQIIKLTAVKVDD